MKQRLDREATAKRAAMELKSGDYVNLGFGIPNLCAAYAGEDVVFQTENGAIGYGPLVPSDEIDKADFHYHDAIGRFWIPAPGMACFDVVTSFCMIRSGRMITILGGLQISEKGDLANWSTGAEHGGTIGGAMDLAFGSKKVIVIMEHVTREGEPRLVRECTYPLTARECVDSIVTDLAVIEVTPDGFMLKEYAPGWTVEEIQQVTEPELKISPDLKEMAL